MLQQVRKGRSRLPRCASRRSQGNKALKTPSNVSAQSSRREGVRLAMVGGPTRRAHCGQSGRVQHGSPLCSRSVCSAARASPASETNPDQDARQGKIDQPECGNDGERPAWSEHAQQRTTKHWRPSLRQQRGTRQSAHQGGVAIRAEQLQGQCPARDREDTIPRAIEDHSQRRQLKIERQQDQSSRHAAASSHAAPGAPG